MLAVPFMIRLLLLLKAYAHDKAMTCNLSADTDCQISIDGGREGGGREG